MNQIATCTISPTYVPSVHFANLYQLKTIFTIVTENPLRICNGAITLFVTESDIIRTITGDINTANY